ncbi:MAG: radical SAM protein [Hyphomonadaceae bacterium]|nr:radical SAM protein [Hyphomonadaceae bacterium]
MDAVQLSRLIAGLLRTGIVRRVRAGLGGSHTTVTYPPLDALSPTNGVEPFTIGGNAPVHLYVHIAFCEFVCSFCHYHRSHSGEHRQAPALRPYLDAVASEIASRRASLAGQPIASIYLGGGTPTAMAHEDLVRLVETLSTLQNLQTTKFCVETSPLTASGDGGRKKLRTLVASGMDRVSIGVQSFEDELLRTHRGHNLATLREALDEVFSLGIRTNVDLMQDLPLQTMDSIDNDLREIERYQPDQVTWYILRLHEGSAMNKIYAPRPEDPEDTLSSVPSSLESAERRAHIITCMTSLGYRRRPGGRFMRNSASEDTYKRVRGGSRANMLGFGSSSYSHGWGYFFRNITDTKVMPSTNDYIRRMRQGGSAVGWAKQLTDIERRASRVCELSREVLPFDALAGDDASASGWRRAASICLDTGIFEKSASGYRLTELGALFEEEIASLFYSQEVRSELRRKKLYWADEAWFNASEPVVQPA